MNSPEPVDNTFGVMDDVQFERLVKQHQVGLLNFFYRLVWDRAVAEDLTQEVFLKLYTRRTGFEPRAKFSTYLYRVGRNCWIDWLRRTKHSRKNRSLDAEDNLGHTLAESVPNRSSAPQDGLQRSETSVRIQEALDSLPEEHRVVFTLSEMQGLRYEEIARTLGIPVGTVKSRMFHAVKRLKEKLGRTLKAENELHG